MAEFCKQCAEELDFEPDFVNLTTAEDEAKGLYAVVLCETCGPIQVNRAGECISDCALHHHVGPYPTPAQPTTSQQPNLEEES